MQWLTDRGIELIRGTGRLAGTGAVEVDGRRYTAEHVVVALGADPFIPPVPGLRELDGVWTNREATGMTAVPRRMLVLGGGPGRGRAGAGDAQLRRRGGDHRGRGPRVIAREPAPLGEALGEALRRDGHRARARGEGDRRPPRRRGLRARARATGANCAGDRLLVATGRRPRVAGIGLETVGIEENPHGIPVDARLSAGERLWALGDVTGIWQLTHVGEYQGEVVASNILGETREAHYEAVPRVTYTNPQAGSVGAGRGPVQRGPRCVREVAKTATYTHAYAESDGFLTLVSDGERLTGAYALGPEAGEWLQQATLAIRARVPLDILRDTIQPFPSFSEIFAAAVKALRGEVLGGRASAGSAS